MATGHTYATLLADAAATLERGVSVTDDIPLDQLPRCINNAERRVARDIKVLGFLVPVTSTMTSGVAVIAKPTNWLRTVSINIGTSTGFNTRKTLFPRAYEYIREYYPDDSATGTPRFYADYDFDHILVGPVPDAAYPFEFNHYAQPRLLDSGNQTNWLTQHAPHLLLAATLLEFSMFLKDDPSQWQADYQAALQAEGGDELKKIADRTSARQGA